jgi:predicted NBD/HSP70 family sugar kinase
VPQDALNILDVAFGLAKGGNACALGEEWYGDSDGRHDLVVVEVSQGLGCGFFVNKAIERGMAGEFGHIQMAEYGSR